MLDTKRLNKCKYGEGFTKALGGLGHGCFCKVKSEGDYAKQTKILFIDS